MKKLLALVLCVMLFVSVIPTSAFADLPEKIDLYPAVRQMNHLNAAYSEFAGKNVVVNMYNGFKEMREVYPEGTEARALVERILVSTKFGQNGFFKTLETNSKNGVAYSPESLFLMFSRIFNDKWYNALGNDIVLDTNAKVDEISDKIDENIAAEIAKLDASIAAAVASAFPNNA